MKIGRGSLRFAATAVLTMAYVIFVPYAVSFWAEGVVVLSPDEVTANVALLALVEAAALLVPFVVAGVVNRSVGGRRWLAPAVGFALPHLAVMAFYLAALGEIRTLPLGYELALDRVGLHLALQIAVLVIGSAITWQLSGGTANKRFHGTAEAVRS